MQLLKANWIILSTFHLSNLKEQIWLEGLMANKIKCNNSKNYIVEIISISNLTGQLFFSAFKFLWKKEISSLESMKNILSQEKMEMDSPTRYFNNHHLLKLAFSIKGVKSSHQRLLSLLWELINLKNNIVLTYTEKPKSKPLWNNSIMNMSVLLIILE